METEPLQGRDEDAIASADSPSMLSEEEKEELKAELVQVCSVILLLCLSPDFQNYCWSDVGLTKKFEFFCKVLRNGGPFIWTNILEHLYGPIKGP